MEEKIIVKGEFSKRNILVNIDIALALLSAMTCLIYFEEYMAYYGFNVYGCGSEYIYFLYATVFFIISAIITYLMMNKCEIIVTNKKVLGKIKFGKRVDLPINQISSLGYSFFKSLTVATSSGVLRFWLLKNREEVFSAISNLLSENQNSSSHIVNKEVNPSNADELKKYKELLDINVITEEEFNAKKKELLGL